VRCSSDFAAAQRDFALRAQMARKPNLHIGLEADFG
jgi:hypothetical protein